MVLTHGRRRRSHGWRRRNLHLQLGMVISRVLHHVDALMVLRRLELMALVMLLAVVELARMLLMVLHCD